MTKDEFIARFRRDMLSFMGEAWAARRQENKEVGAMMDLHMVHAKRLMNEMYDALVPPVKPEPKPSNGAAKTEVKR
jgi:hypothetical protein